MKVLITGIAGFIGFHLGKSLLNGDYEVLGIDNLNDYYSPILKDARLDILKNYNNFTFKKIDISEKESLAIAFQSFKPQKVVNLAAQAGVRYSIENPYAYMDSNLVGFLNIIELCRQKEVEGLIYASSSSVYGSSTNIPFNEKDRVNSPIALYGATKRANELIAHAYSYLYNLPTTGLRFFTVYGPWGRPDMAMYIFTRKIIAGEKILVFNNGKMKRDFTYINDIINGTRSAINKNFKCEIFNLGNHRSEHLMDMIGLIEKKLKKKAQIEYLPMQPGDIKESFADIKHASDLLNYSPTVNIEEGINHFISWYRDYHK